MVDLRFVAKINSLWIQILSERVLNPSNHTPVVLPTKVLGSRGIILFGREIQYANIRQSVFSAFTGRSQGLLLRFPNIWICLRRYLKIQWFMIIFQFKRMFFLGYLCGKHTKNDGESPSLVNHHHIWAMFNSYVTVYLEVYLIFNHTQRQVARSPAVFADRR